MSSRRKNNAEPRSTAYLYLEGNPQPIPLFDKFQFGRMESFDNPAVSRTHFTIAANEFGVYFIIDHESRAGTRVNAKPIKPGEWHELEEGFLVAVGPYTFEFSFKPAHKRAKPKLESKQEIKSDSIKSRSQQKEQRRSSGKSSESSKLSLQPSDSGRLIIEKAPRISSPMPQLPKREPRLQNIQTDEDYAGRLRLFLMICAVITVLTVVVVQNRKQSSRDQMLPYYAGYMNVMKQYYKNYGQYQQREKEISVYERDQNVLVKQLRELESDLRAERPVDRKADYFKKHILFLVSKTVSHSVNSQKYFRSGKFNYFSLAKQDDADISQEIALMTAAFGLKPTAHDLKDRESPLRVPATADVPTSSEKVKPKAKKVRGKKARTPF